MSKIISTPSKYLNPYTDFGFKKLFGEEGSKDLLHDFLNQLSPQHHQIVELSFKKTEKYPAHPKNARQLLPALLYLLHPCSRKRFMTFIAKPKKANVLLLKCKKPR